MTEQEIIASCIIYGIKKYNIGDDGLVNVTGNVSLSDMQLEQLPLQFGHVSGGFYCQRNRLTTLFGSPHTVGGDFLCSENYLKSLKYLPRFIGGKFHSRSNSSLRTYELRYALLSTIKSEIYIGDSWGDFTASEILSAYRIGGVIPSELIPGKIRQLKDMT